MCIIGLCMCAYLSLSQTHTHTYKTTEILFAIIYSTARNKPDDVKNQNKPAALCIVGFIGDPLSDNTVIIRHFNIKRSGSVIIMPKNNFCVPFNSASTPKKPALLKNCIPKLKIRL